MQFFVHYRITLNVYLHAGKDAYVFLLQNYGFCFAQQD